MQMKNQVLFILDSFHFFFKIFYWFGLVSCNIWDLFATEMIDFLALPEKLFAMRYTDSYIILSQ